MPGTWQHAIKNKQRKTKQTVVWKGFREFVKTGSCMHCFVRMRGSTIIFGVGENIWLSLEYQRSHNFKTSTITKIINKQTKNSKD